MKISIYYINQRFLLAIFILLLSNTACIAAFSEEKQQWLRNNLVKPRANFSFTLNVDKTMLDPQADKLTGQLPVFNYSEMTDGEILKKIKEYPLHAEFYIQLNQRFRKAGKYEQSVELIQQAINKILGDLDKDGANWQLILEAQKIYQVVRHQGKSRKIATFFLKNNPDNVDAMLNVAKFEILAVDFKTARNRIDKAYLLSPKGAEVYLTEYFYQINRAMAAVNKQGLSDSVSLPVALGFLEQAAKENPGIMTPQVTLHGLQVIRIFYSGVLSNYSKFDSKKAFNFKVDKHLQTELIETKKFFQEALIDKRVNPYFSYICLLMAAIIENDQIAAEQMYAKLTGFSQADNEMYRIKVVDDFSRADFSAAIEHISASIKDNDNIQDRLMLAQLFRMDNNLSDSLQVLLDYSGEMSGEIFVHRIGYGLLGLDPERGVELYQQYKTIKPLWKNGQFVYYAVVAESLIGNNHHAQKILESLPKENIWHKDCEQAIKNLQDTNTQP